MLATDHAEHQHRRQHGHAQHHRAHRGGGGAAGGADQRGHHGADPELHAAQHRGRRTGRLAVPGQRECGSVRHRQARERDQQRQRDEHARQAAEAGQADREQGGGGGHRPEDRPGEHGADVQPAQQHRVELRGEGQAGGVEAEDQPEGAGVQPEAVLEHERRPRDVGEHRRHHRPADEGERHEDPVAEQRAVGGQGRADGGRPAPRHRQRLADADGGDHDEQQRGPGQHHEDAAPGGEAQHDPAEGRRQDRREPDHQHQSRHDPGHRDPGEQVPDDRHRHHRQRRPGQALHDPHPGEHADGGGDRAQQRGPGVRGEADHQRPASAEGIGERADHQLPDGQAEKHAGQRQLDRGVAGGQVVGDPRERRQVHVDAQRAQRDERAQHHHQLDVAAAGRGRRGLAGRRQGGHGSSLGAPCDAAQPAGGGRPPLPHSRITRKTLHPGSE